MSYMNYTEQLQSHLSFLCSKGFDLTELRVDAGFVRCLSVGMSKGRGELSYKTTSKKLDNGQVGLGTWCRGVDGLVDSFQTYGQSPTGGEFVAPNSTKPIGGDVVAHEEAARRAYGFWMHSDSQGESDYLKRKGVGSYGIRFRSTEKYGKVAVVPMYDIEGRLWNYQLLNPDGTKRDLKNARTSGLFLSLRPVISGDPFGIAESYVTAATCMELTSIPCVCCFGCDNLEEVATSLSEKYKASQIILFADNDRHLSQNKGLVKAQGVQNKIPDRVVVVEPNFDALPVLKEVSDWNDLVRVFGVEEVKVKIHEAISQKTGSGELTKAQTTTHNDQEGL